MKINSSLLLVLCLVYQISIGQTPAERMLRGTIRVDATHANGISILNLSTDKSTTTNQDGEFGIMVRINDVLVFTAVNVETTKRVVKQEDFMLGLIHVEMKGKATPLKAVIINSNAINAVSERIVAKEPKKYTVAERRLRTAGDFKPIMLLGLLGGVMPLDPIINKINGRTKRLKKLVFVEKKEKYIKMISEWYEHDYFTTQLGLPAEYVSGFKYYLVENEFFVKILESKDQEKITFYLVGLAQDYNNLLKSEGQIDRNK